MQTITIDTFVKSA